MSHDLGAMSALGTGTLLRTVGNIDGVYMSQLLEEGVESSMGEFKWKVSDFVLQQDNAAVHRAQVVKDMIASKGWTTIAWPSYFADISPIENVWSYIK